MGLNAFYWYQIFALDSVANKTQNCLTRMDPYINPYKPIVFFVGHRQSMQTQIRRHETVASNQVSTVRLLNDLLEFE